MGESAEGAAVAHLVALGWRIVARNVRVHRDEIDVIAIEPAMTPALVFVEVRSGTVTRFGAPEESVGPQKVGRLYRAAMAVVRGGTLPNGSELPDPTWRVDLITLVRDDPASPWRVTAHIRGLRPP